MILSANTYAQAKGYWPYADDQGEYGEKLNNLTKFVASSKLDDAPWGDFPAATVTRDRPPPSGSSRSRAARTSRGLARPEAGRGHRVRKRRGTSALRDQEISGKSALPLPTTGRRTGRAAAVDRACVPLGNQRPPGQSSANTGSSCGRRDWSSPGRCRPLRREHGGAQAGLRRSLCVMSFWRCGAD